MVECEKCGANVKEDMSFCPNCGAPLKKAVASAPQSSTPPQAPTPQPEPYYRYEKEEKREKQEKQEKGEKREKHEKGEYGWIGPFVAGIALIFIGLISYFEVTGILTQTTQQILGAFFIIIIGLLLIFGAIYAMTTARRRYPRT
jgi:cation transport ATPase